MTTTHRGDPSSGGGQHRGDHELQRGGKTLCHSDDDGRRHATVMFARQGLAVPATRKPRFE
ncbi:toxin-antitoxin system, toxin component, RelE domain protein [Corynebacterium kroppenstedtii]|nr:toxin-antitoxin system, toxin component, RelE domain protein [Corynebacterium kroppenstedtii]